MPEAQHILHLYGAASQAEIVNFLRTQCEFGNQDELKSVIDGWRSAAERFAQITSGFEDLPESIKVSSVPKEFKTTLEDLEREPLFSNTFSLIPHSVEIVEIDKLVAGQRYVNLDHIKRIESTIPESPTLKSLINFCLKTGPPPPVPTDLQLAPNVYSYKSESTDFRFIGGYPKKLTEDDIRICLGGGQPVAGIMLFVGYGSPAINVFKVGQRYILNNGFHRAFALRKRGVDQIPVVVQNISNWNLELPPILVGLPTAYLVTTRRPSLVKDFFDPDISHPLLMKNRDRSVQIQWNVNQLDIPK